MPLGSAAKSTIDIDFTRAQGVNSSGRITFRPPRIRIGTTMISSAAVSVDIKEGVGSIDLARLPSGVYHVREEIDGRPPYEWDFSLPTGAAAVLQYEEIAAVAPVPAVYTYVRTVNNVAPDPTTGNVVLTGGTGDVVGPAAAVDNAVARFDGATGKLVQSSGVGVDDTDQVTGVNAVIFDPVTSPAYQRGKLVYSDNADAEALTWFNVDSEVELHLGRELQIPVRNASGATITPGQAVYINGNHTGTGLPTVALARADAFGTARCVGLAAHAIENNTNGYVYAVGIAHHNINTAAFGNGDTLYLSDSVAGALTVTPPSSPNYQVRVGVVTRASAGNGAIYVTTGARLLGNGTANQVMAMNGTGTAPVYKTLTKSDVGLANVNDVAQVPISLFDAAGDLLVGIGNDAAAALPKGTNGQVLAVVGGSLTWVAPAAGAPAHRIVRVTDMSQLTPSYYPVQDTASAWALLTGSPEYTIAAAVGEDIQVDWDCLVESATNWWQDLVVVTGGTPSIQRYLTTKTASPAFEGVPGNYPVGASFQGRQFTGGFVATVNDIDGGLVRFRWAVKSASATGRMYASPNYPLNVNIRNSRVPA